jgi:S1-C subfamily serine protease
VTPLDWIIVALVGAMGLAGAAQGLVVGAATLAGFGLGLLVGGRVGQALIESGSQSPYAPVFGLVGAVAGGALFAGLLQTAGARFRSRLRLPGLALFDGLGGAVLSAAIGLGLVWLAAAVALQAPGASRFRQDILRSEVITRLNATLPPSGPILNALARFDPFPQIEGPPASVAPPRAAIARDPEVQAAAAGVVKITGTSCGLGVEGSGWIAAPEVVVTNAHVVAGQEDTRVQLRGEGERLAAQAIAFDARNDVAVLRVPGLGGTPLPLFDRPSGTAAAILGFPENGPYDVRAGRLGATRTVVTQDAYGRGPVTRELVTLRGRVRPGNSGGPMVDGRGRVVTTIFAATRSGPRGGYGVPNRIVERAISTATGPVGTGPCGG